MPDSDSKHTFIPKGPVAASVSGKRKNRSLGVVLVVSFIIFISSVLSASGAYLYRTYLVKSTANLEISLNKAKAAFEPETIVSLKRFNARVNAGDSLLARHIAPTVFFSALQDLTLQSIRFSKFSYTFDDLFIEGTLSGTARNYSSVALQSDFFARSPYIKNPIFSNLTLDKSGNVTFNVAFKIDPALMLYTSVAGQNTASVREEIPQ
ncbi:MAG: hypothetical protein AAB805_01130 [Patescibacteria group bacterium]